MDWLTHPAIKFFLPALKVVTYHTDLALFSVITKMSSESSLECLESLAKLLMSPLETSPWMGK